MEVWTTFLQVLCFVVIIYWSIDLSARFWYLVMILYTFAMVGVSLGMLVGSGPKVSRKWQGAILMAPSVLCRLRVCCSQILLRSTRI
jgi:hypothetical protein